MTRDELFSFPNPVNEVSARIVAAGVVLMVVATLTIRRPWLLFPLAYGFLARVLTGPTLSPLGQLSTRIVTPMLPLEPRPVPGPPKRFAQGIGAACTITALVLAYGFRRTGAAYFVVALVGAFATLESGFGYCVGCKVFALLMQLGIIPEEVCADCADIHLRRRQVTAAP
jgi:hypothetical protein